MALGQLPAGAGRSAAAALVASCEQLARLVAPRAEHVALPPLLAAMGVTLPGSRACGAQQQPGSAGAAPTAAPAPAAWAGAGAGAGAGTSAECAALRAELLRMRAAHAAELARVSEALRVAVADTARLRAVVAEQRAHAHTAHMVCAW